MGILVHKGIKAGPLPHKGAHADRWAPYLVAGKMGEWMNCRAPSLPRQKSSRILDCVWKKAEDALNLAK